MGIVVASSAAGRVYSLARVNEGRQLTTEFIAHTVQVLKLLTIDTALRPLARVFHSGQRTWDQPRRRRRRRRLEL